MTLKQPFTFWQKLVLLALCVFAIKPTFANQSINDSVALNGIKEVKIVLLVDLPHPQSAAGYLREIDAMRQSYIQQGVTPKMVLVFQGETVRYLSKNPGEDLTFEFEKDLKSIADSVAKFKELGIRMEICSVATNYFKVDNDSILPGMTVVGDSAISMVGWQYQGYKAIY
ncbi:DsrE family protein [Thiomicrorhabdus sp. 6S2-11]|uniref:DsrE family protein n=1 Tax=Thiomicrorhabdus marina TaxID=2818442 RepID=A0ABS3Q279_9GAMM|nr:DsrE family protein [Thiomicrorhabdus marina]MBO1926430.1 DsrE family protein [Thiomicrorhabdus marina]